MNRTVLRRGLLALFLLPISLVPGAAQTASDQLTGELARLRQEMKKIPDADEEWKSIRPDIEGLLAAAEGDLKAGRLYTAVESLGLGRHYLLASLSRQSHAALSNDMDGFLAEWTGGDHELAAGEETYRAGGWGNVPAAVRALAESELGQVRPLYHASRDYAYLTSAGTGFHYLGESRAALDFASFSRTLRFDGPAGTIAPRSVASEIQKLRARIVAAYQPPHSIDDHRDFIRVHATLKLATELDQAALYYGALYSYLRALRVFSVMEGQWASAPPPDAAHLRNAAAGAAARLEAAGIDNSIGALFLQQAQRAIEKTQAPEGSAADSRTAAALLDQVLPAYFEAIGGGTAPEAPRSDAVRVTLVRWPYT
jgi:hypothetical protein